MNCINNAIDFLWDNFCYRYDAYTVMDKHPWQDRENWYRRVYEPLTKEIIKLHLTGDITIGVFPTRIEDQTVKFICWDVDDITPVTLQWAIMMASNYGVPLIEESGKVGRYHVWIVFDDPISLYDARQMRGTAIHGVDFFPHRDRVINDFYYELPIKLPLGYHRQAKRWSKFVDLADCKLGC